MKTTFTSFILIAGLLTVSVFTNSCAKPDHSADKPKEQQVVGKWTINRIQLKIYSGSTFVKDTILSQSLYPNTVTFDANGGFQYKFNTTTPDVGTYAFSGATSLVTNSAPKSYNWTMLTLTNVLFTVVSKGTDPAFPGYNVERYQTFTR